MRKQSISGPICEALPPFFWIVGPVTPSVAAQNLSNDRWNLREFKICRVAFLERRLSGSSHTKICRQIYQQCSLFHSECEPPMVPTSVLEGDKMTVKQMERASPSSITWCCVSNTKVREADPGRVVLHSVCCLNACTQILVGVEDFQNANTQQRANAEQRQLLQTINKSTLLVST